MRGPVLFALLLGACQAGTIEAPASSAEVAGKLELVDAPARTADIAAYVAPLVPRAAAEHKKLVVYVGAAWCEPCRYFHAAAAAGELDSKLGDVRLVVFDADRDGEALRAAGYTAPMIPLFALPAADGQASGMQIAGSVKGEAAVAQIAPRLRTLVDAP